MHMETAFYSAGSNLDLVENARSTLDVLLRIT